MPDVEPQFFYNFFAVALSLLGVAGIIYKFVSDYIKKNNSLTATLTGLSDDIRQLIKELKETNANVKSQEDELNYLSRKVLKHDFQIERLEDCNGIKRIKDDEVE